MLVNKSLLMTMLGIILEYQNANYNPNQKRDNLGRWTKYNYYQEEDKDFKNKIVSFAKHSKENKLYEGYLTIGKLSSHAQKVAMNYNINLSGYIHNIDAKAIRHKRNGHEKSLSDEDLKYIPEIIYNPDEIIYYQRKGVDHINYKKRISKNIFLYIEEVRNKKKYLTTKTIYKIIIR